MLYALPSITEDVFSRYVASQYTGSYPVAKSFTTDAAGFPAIIVKAGKFSEESPGTGLYNGTLAVAVFTQIDDVADPLTVHDNTVAAAYAIMADASLFDFANSQGNFHLFYLQLEGYDQEADTKGRELVGVLEYRIGCQLPAQ